MNMASDLRAREDISRVLLANNRTMTTNTGICEAFRDYIQDIFNSVQALHCSVRRLFN